MKQVIVDTIKKSPDPYSDTMSAIINALRTGIASNGGMNMHEATILQRIFNLACSLDPGTEDIQ